MLLPNPARQGASKVFPELTHPPKRSQDDKEEKLKGVRSLIKYATLSDYMLVPTEEREMQGAAARFPEEIPGYGRRAWCRCEYFIFSLAAEMRECEVELYAILLDGALHQYPAVKVRRGAHTPGLHVQPYEGSKHPHLVLTVLLSIGGRRTVHAERR